MAGMWVPWQNNFASRLHDGGTISRDGYAARDRLAPPIHRHLVLKILDSNNDHGLLDVVFENHLVDIGIFRGR
jgi:hypothetical protein